MLLYRSLLILIALGFAVAFAVIVGPPLLESRDIVAGLKAGFVNPYATGYSLDAILSWVVLAIWVFHEAGAEKIKHGWIAVVLGAVPGVATGFAVYLLMRSLQLGARARPA